MLKHAGQYALQLLETLEPEVCGDSSRKVAITEAAAVTRQTAGPKTVAKAEAAVMIRQRRQEWDQDVAFGARPFILCGLPIRSLPSGTNKYTRRNGRFFLEIVGHPDHGVPFGQDRLVLIWVATLAVRHQSPLVEFDTASQMSSLIRRGPLRSRNLAHLDVDSLP